MQRTPLVLVPHTSARLWKVALTKEPVGVCPSVAVDEINSRVGGIDVLVNRETAMTPRDL